MANFFKELFGGGKKKSAGGILGAVLGTQGGGGGLLGAIGGVSGPIGTIVQAGTGIASGIVQERAQKEAFKKARKRAEAERARLQAQGAAAPRITRSFVETFLPESPTSRAMDESRVIPGGVRSRVFSGGIKRGAGQLASRLVNGRQPRFIGSTPSVSQALAAVGRRQESKSRPRALPGGAEFQPRTRLTSVSGVVERTGRVLRDVTKSIGLPGFGVGGRLPRNGGQQMPVANRSRFIERRVGLQLNGRFGPLEALNPVSGCVEPIDQIRQQGLKPKRPFVRFDAMTGQFVTQAPRRMNVCNVKALSRAARRLKGFDRFVRSNFQIEKKMKFKPKTRRRRR